jgi:hypothetical protein
MSQSPKFERAVGITQTVFQCLESHCKQFFRAAAGTTQCPHCNGTRVKDSRANAVQGTGPK